MTGACSESMAALIEERFLERRDVKAVQQSDGGYRPDRSAFTRRDLHSHLAGERTLGHYLVSPEGNCRLFAFDIDIVKPKPDADPPVVPKWRDELGMEHVYESPRDTWLTVDPRVETDDTAVNYLRVGLAHMAEGLAAMVRRILDVPVAVAYSGGKGVHVYGFTGSAPAADVREAAISVIEGFGRTFGAVVDNNVTSFQPTRGQNFYRHTMEDSPYQSLEIEVFPKQDAVTDLGNLMRLPLGINQKTGQPGYFRNFDDGRSTFAEDDPIAALTEGTIR